MIATITQAAGPVYVCTEVSKKLSSSLEPSLPAAVVCCLFPEAFNLLVQVFSKERLLKNT